MSDDEYLRGVLAERERLLRVYGSGPPKPGGPRDVSRGFVTNLEGWHRRMQSALRHGGE